MKFERERMREALSGLAAQGVYLGTSSWKYPGWCGLLYEKGRYGWRGRFAQKRFEQMCLEEYSEVFQTVCVDAAYYKFPERHYLEGLANQVPEGFRFGFKVTDEITMRRWPELPRYGEKAGSLNGNFLNPDLFAESFLAPCGVCRDKLGLLIFEFAKMHPGDYRNAENFLGQLDEFLGALPPGWPYGVELRNPELLGEGYFAVLRRHGVTHVLNSWGDMPSISEQSALSAWETNPALYAARLLLKPGRRYEDAVRMFSPYDRTREVNLEARGAAAALIRRVLAGGSNQKDRRVFIFVNNRLEGNALHTIAAIVEESVGLPALPVQPVRFEGNQGKLMLE